ncbi:MAG: quercetin dioxygenase-like cupin family protein [Gammaproteobacteria bacterium]|jgi:quercetin dioxygenase-like cupin family protein
MDAVQFLAHVQAQGFPAPMEVTRPPEAFSDTHTHDFTALIMVRAGAYTIATADGLNVYAAGDVYTLEAGTAHAETAGPQGAELLISRR